MVRSSFMKTGHSDVLRNLVPFVQFKKREKHSWRSVNFSKVAGLKLTLVHDCFSRCLNCTSGTNSRNASQVLFFFKACSICRLLYLCFKKNLTKNLWDSWLGKGFHLCWTLLSGNYTKPCNFCGLRSLLLNTWDSFPYLILTSNPSKFFRGHCFLICAFPISNPEKHYLILF